LLEGDELTLVDPGTSLTVPRLLEWLRESSYSLTELNSILLTHIHLDHAGATGHLADELSGLKVYVHARGAPHLVDPSKLLESVKEATGTRFSEYGTLKPVPEERIIPLDGKDDLKVGSRELIVLPTPGHAPHHLVYKDKSTGAVFTGDSAGLYLESKLIPATPPPRFDLEKSLASLDEIRQLDPSVLLYSHFGPGANPDRLIDDYKIALREWVDLISDLFHRHEREENLIDEVLKRKRGWLGEGFTEEELVMNIKGVERYLSWKGN
jgi:glyoxylase-like metal-dependent hydrolase (beta-lactamase superfamily II)